MEKKYYLGTSGWSYDHWVGEFYPEGMDRKLWLQFYAKHFNTAEVNMTFYRFPWRNVVKGWYNKTPEDFRFTLKVHRSITHVHKLRNVKKLLNSFYDMASPLKEKLGCLLYQLPPSMHLDLERLEAFIEMLPADKVHAFEFRHNSWYCRNIYRLLKKHKAVFCAVSAPGFPEDLEVTANAAYIRFHGKGSWYSYDYSGKELKEWVNKIKSSNAKGVYAYFNNDANAYAVKNCLSLKRMLG